MPTAYIIGMLQRRPPSPHGYHLPFGKKTTSINENQEKAR